MQTMLPGKQYCVYATLLVACVCAAATTKQDELPPGPALFQPEPNAQITADTVALQWMTFEGADLFRVQLADSRDFTTILLDDSTTYHFYVVHDLPQNGDRLFWRIRACQLLPLAEDSREYTLHCLSEWSAVSSFVSVDPDRTSDDDGANGGAGFFARILGCDSRKSSGDTHPLLSDLLLIGTALALIFQYGVSHGQTK